MTKPTSKRKEREREARREAILDAAANVFARKSFYEATLDEIAAEAELAKGTLYNYFRDKEDLFQSLIYRGTQQYHQLVEKIIGECDSLRILLVRLITESLAMMHEHRYMLRMALTAGAHLSEKMTFDMMTMWKQETDLAVEKLAGAIVNLPEAGRLSIDDGKAGAMLVLATVRSLHIRNATVCGDKVSEEEIENYVRLLHRALTVEKGE
jgi:AcrR family transcriptional regulator